MNAEARLLVFAVALAFLCATVAAGNFTVSPSSGSASCPSVSWAGAAAGQRTTFVLTSSKRTSAANNWVSFAFATGQYMNDTLVVVDCYDLNNTLAVRTSKNVPGGNVDSPANLSTISNTSIRVDQGIYTCTFNMTLPTESLYAILAEGLMSTSSSAPQKLYHANRKWSSSGMVFNSSSAAGASYTASCDSASYPSIRWTDASPGQQATFVLTSSKRTSPANNWVSFAFATGQKMKDTLVIVDCYDLNTKLAVRTSKNIPGGNVDSPTDLPTISNASIRFDQGVYNCTFNMALPSQSVYAIIAEGAMDGSSSDPKKMYHGDKKWWSSNIVVNSGHSNGKESYLHHWCLVAIAILAARATTDPLVRVQ